MTLAQLRSRTKIGIKDLDEGDSSDELIDAIINEGLREMARETLLLDGYDSSLTYSSPGFTLPTDFIKARDLQWKTSNNVYTKIEPTSIDHVYVKRDISSSDNSVAKLYAIERGKIVLDTTTSSSSNLILYYFKYDTALSSGSSSPSFDSEFHKYLINYTIWQLTGRDVDRQLWERGLKVMLQTKTKSSGKRMRYKVI